MMAKVIKFPKKPKRLEDATYWIPTETNPGCKGLITVGKKYRIHYSKIRDEYFMYDDRGYDSVWFITVPGELI